MGKGLDMQATISMDISISPSKLDIGIGLTEELGPSTNISKISTHDIVNENHYNNVSIDFLANISADNRITADATQNNSVQND